MIHPPSDAPADGGRGREVRDGEGLVHPRGPDRARRLDDVVRPLRARRRFVQAARPGVCCLCSRWTTTSVRHISAAHQCGGTSVWHISVAHQCGTPVWHISVVAHQEWASHPLASHCCHVCAPRPGGALALPRHPLGHEHEPRGADRGHPLRHRRLQPRNHNTPRLRGHHPHPPARWAGRYSSLCVFQRR